MSKRKTYLQNAALLTGSGLVLRALGMGFRIVLAAYLGSEGMGLYQLILALYMVFVSFATAGVNVASARLAAQSLARGSGMAETLRGLCITALGFGTEENMAAVRAMKSSLASWHDATPVCLIDRKRLGALAAEQGLAGYTPLERLVLATLGGVVARSGVTPADKRALIVLATTKGEIGSLGSAPERCDLNRTAEVVGRYFGTAHRPLLISNACISGVSAIVIAARLIRSGRYDHVFVAGFDLLSDFIVSGFNAFKSVSPTLCRPYDAARDGLTLGEACGAVLLTRDRRLSGTGVSVAGGGISNDGAFAHRRRALVRYPRGTRRGGNRSRGGRAGKHPRHGDRLQRRDGEQGAAPGGIVRRTLQLAEALFRTYAGGFGRDREHRHGTGAVRGHLLRGEGLRGVRGTLPARRERRAPRNTDGHGAENRLGIRGLQRRGRIPPRSGLRRRARK